MTDAYSFVFILLLLLAVISCSVNVCLATAACLYCCDVSFWFVGQAAVLTVLATAGVGQAEGRA